MIRQRYVIFKIPIRYTYVQYVMHTLCIRSGKGFLRFFSFDLIWTNAWLANYNVSRTNTLRVLRQSCGSLVAVLCVLRLPYTSQKTQANRKENEHVENSLRQPCDLVFRTAVLRCSILHREAAARNPEICRRLPQG